MNTQYDVVCETSNILEIANNLKVKDGIKFGKFSIKDLSEKSFSIEAINSYSFDDKINTVFTLSDNNKSYYMTIIDSDRNPYICVSVKLKKQQIQNIFDEDELNDLLEVTDEKNIIIETAGKDNLNDWVDDSYALIEHSENCFKYYGKDKILDREDFCYLLLESANNKALEIEIYYDRVEVLLSVYLSEKDIQAVYG